MNNHTKESLIESEQAVIDLFNAGELPYLLHISGGNEQELIDIFKSVNPNDYVLGTHRAHYHFLLKGATREELVNQVLAGKSMFLFSKKLNFLTSSIVAGLTAVAVGLGMGIAMAKEDRHVWCFVGDGGEDEGHFYEAVRYAYGHRLPVTFIIEDNNRSVESSVEDRWGPRPVRLAWPDNVIVYKYEPTYPHAGTGLKKMVSFKPEAIERAKKSWD